MPLLLLALFIAIPLVEIYILIEVGRTIGALETVALCILTALVGAALLRHQGVQTLQRAHRSLDRGAVPALEMFEGIALFIGGVLLLTPGFATDLLGFACLIPGTRQLMVRAVMRRAQVHYGPVEGQVRPGRDGEGRKVIEGEYERRDED